MTIAAEIEREFKFDVDADFDPPDLRPVVGRTVRLPEVEQRTTYFDTADHRLWARGITLRHRVVLSGSGSGGAGSPGTWTLKLPEDGSPDGDAAQASARAELTWTGPIDGVPDAAARIVAGVVRRAPLTTVAELSAVRRRLLLHHPDTDRPWAEIDDDLVSVTAGPNAGRRFRQIELELTAGTEPPAGELDAVLAQLRDAGALPGGGSKLGTALGLAPAAASPPSPAGATVADVVRHVLADDLAALLDFDYRLRRAAEDGTEADVELIHRARVATRRFRAHVRTLAPVLDPVWVGHVKQDLRSFGQALGRVRDADVLMDRLRAHDDPDDGDAVAELTRLVAADRALAVTDLAPAMASGAYLDLLDRLSAATSAPPLYSAEQDHPGGLPARPALRRLVGRRWRRVASDLADLPADPGAAELHQVRVRAKRLRYASEAVAPFVGKKARRTAKAAERLQDVLGEIHDAAAAASWLRQLASHPSLTSADAFVAGRIAGRAEGSARALCAAWPEAARRLTAKKVRSWLA